MPYYRKKPVVIQAERCATLIHDAAHNWGALPPWFRDAHERGAVTITQNQIHLTEWGFTSVAELADWVICDAKGELAPCKAGEFVKVYEPA